MDEPGQRRTFSQISFTLSDLFTTYDAAPTPYLHRNDRRRLRLIGAFLPGNAHDTPFFEKWLERAFDAGIA
jgi:hypothetical protein